MAVKMISKPQVWDARDRSGLGADGDVIEKLVSVPLDPEKPKDDHFDLYYFVRTPRNGLADKTVLFCSGGPGEIVRTSDETIADFLTEVEYNVVYFHLRGSGFSQIPPVNLFDRFLRTSYAVADIEQIRKDFLGEAGKWDALIAYSYGTVLAHRYAHCHSCKVRKLILVAPISRHMFKESANAFDDFAKNARLVHKMNLESIYDSKGDELEDEFKDLQGENGRPGKKDKILEKLFGDQDGIFQKIEDAFGSVQFVINAYHDLKEELKKYDLDKYSRDFFCKLRELRHVGSSALGGFNERRLEIGKVIRNEVLSGEQVRNERASQNIQDSERAFYAITIQDGINPRFLKEWLSGGSKDPRQALKRSGGEAHVKFGVNPSLEKLCIDSEQQIGPWDPAEIQHQHSVPTLILNGQADPVTAGGQAEYFYLKALTGPRTFIELPGIGHEISLPFVNGDTETSLASGTVRLDPIIIPSQNVRAVTGSINGLKLNKRLRLNLEPPPELEPQLKVVGLGKIYQGLEKKEQHGIVGLLKNTGDTFKGNGKETDWKISNDFFSGTVRFKVPTIKRGEQQLVSGTLVHGGRNPQREVRLKPEGDLEPGIEVLGFIIDPPPDNFVTIWLLNRGDKTIKLAGRKWTIENSFFRKSFTVRSDEIDPVKPNKVVKVFASVDGRLPLDKDDDLDLVMDFDVVKKGRMKSLEACIIPQDEMSSRLGSLSLDRKKHESYEIPISIINNGGKFDGVGGDWQIENPMFSVTVRVGHLEVDAGSGKRIFGRVKGVTWKKILKLSEPEMLEPGLELVGFNIIAEDKISVLMRNKGTLLVNGTARDWIYVDPRREDLDSSESEDSDELWPDKLLNRLMYSFLFLNAEQFKACEENEILDTMPDAFPDNSPIQQLVGETNRSINKRNKSLYHPKHEFRQLDMLSSSKLQDGHLLAKGARP
jgi:pimeloyl-ACP methyl ester carboxylesterase